MKNNKVLCIHGLCSHLSKSSSQLALVVSLVFGVATSGLADISDESILKRLNSKAEPDQVLSWYISEDIDLNSILDKDDRIKAYHSLGRLFYQAGNSLEAQSQFATAIELIGDKPNNAALASSIYNDMGLSLVARNYVNDATVYFSAAEAWARAADDPELLVVSGLNLVRNLLQAEEYDRIESLISSLKVSLENLVSSRSLAQHWLSYGQLIKTSIVKQVLSPETRLESMFAYNNALSFSEATNDQHLTAYANGFLGELYEDEARYADAERYTRKALFHAQEVSDDTSLYIWQWQMARLFKKQDKWQGATEQYRQAVDTLKRARTSLTLGTGVNFKQSVGPVFYEFADMLLHQAPDIAKDSQRQERLEEVIDVLEAVKLAEVEDYFDSECVVLPDQKIKLAEFMSDAAVIYPILLADRLELLVQLPSGIQQFSVKVSAAVLRETVNQYRSLIETYDRDNGFLGSAQLLYSWLVKPAEQALKEADVSTVVFVPDGPLRSIPISALHDGDKFLIQKYAVATTPGITLTDPKPFSRDNIRVLASGLTEGVQGYSPLPSVKQELKNISAVFETQLYQDNDYQLNTVEGEMSSGGYNIVHFATHGEFNSDHNKSFLLTYDKKLTMNQLENTIGLRRFQSEPIELLVLSACQTAVGDDQAALGLAGVAIKAGARSALATLWFINDQATSYLVADFYRQLNKDKQTKAKALQAAQVNMITKTQYKHPSFWAPFLMIGNWL
jgi:CHAT domain-containing protein